MILHSGSVRGNGYHAFLGRDGGIGQKTARFFLLHSRPGQRLAALDTYMLDHLCSLGIRNVPEETPQSPARYRALEQEILRLAREARMSPARYDLWVWCEMQARKDR